MEITWDFIKQYYEKYEILARFCAESLEEVQILHHGIIGRLFIKNSELVWECMAFHWWWNPLKDFYQWRNSLETIELQVIKELEPFFFDRNDMIFDTAVICVYLLNRKYKEALEIINDLIKRTPTEISFLGFRSLILMNLLDFDAAITEFNDLIKLDGSNVIWFINKALALGACNNAGAALQCLEIANTLSHNHNEILWNKGVILLNSGDIPQATRYFDEFYHNESKKFNANFILYDIIHLFESIGRSDEAVKYRSMIGSYRDTHPKHE
ncbi:MAG TPA: hypothetical protein VKM55_18930 [Candidatus Lokiarchaeia archaeon]|nr:hypothetical protein [Candidatus Lokiarchaeia archaeon]